MHDLGTNGQRAKRRGILPLAEFLFDDGRDLGLAAQVVFPVLVELGPIEALDRQRVFCPMLLPTAPMPEDGGLEGEYVRFHLGRGPTNEIDLDATSVSKNHAALVRRDGDAWALVDRGSANGTFLGSERLVPGTPHDLDPHGPSFRLGSHELRFMRAPELAAHVRELEAAVRARSPAGTRRHRVTVATDHALVEKILLSAKMAPIVPRRFTVHLDCRRVEIVHAWPDFADLVEARAAKITSVEVAEPGGKPFVVYQRAAVTRRLSA